MLAGEFMLEPGRYHIYLQVAGSHRHQASPNQLTAWIKIGDEPRLVNYGHVSYQQHMQWERIPSHLSVREQTRISLKLQTGNPGVILRSILIYPSHRSPPTSSEEALTT